MSKSKNNKPMFITLSGDLGDDVTLVDYLTAYGYKSSSFIMPKSCVIGREKCYNPKWVGKADKNGNRRIKCLKQADIKIMKEKHKEKEKALKTKAISKGKKLLQRICKHSKNGFIEYNWDYRFDGLYTLKNGKVNHVDWEDKSDAWEDKLQKQIATARKSSITINV